MSEFNSRSDIILGSEEKKQKATDKLLAREEKKRQKEEALAAGPKPRGRPRKPKGDEVAEAEVAEAEVAEDGDSTAALRGSPVIKAPLKKRRVKGDAEPSGGSKQPPAEKVAAEAKAKVKGGKKATMAKKGGKDAQEEGGEGKGEVVESDNAEKAGKVEEKDIKNELEEKEGKNVGKAPLGMEPKQPTAAEIKRNAKANLGLKKLHDNLNTQDGKDMSLPGSEFQGKCWTAIPFGDHFPGCKIRIILYQESFYVVDGAVVPDYMSNLLHVAWI